MTCILNRDDRTRDQVRLRVFKQIRQAGNDVICAVVAHPKDQDADALAA